MTLRTISRGLALVLLVSVARLMPAQTASAAAAQTQNPPTQTQPGQTQPGDAQPGQTQPGQSDSGASSTGAGQTDENAPAIQPAADEEQQPTARHSTMAPAPLPLNIDASSLQFGDEEPRRNTIFGGINGEVTYDDNLLSQEAQKTGGASYSLFPNLGVNISRPRLLLDLDYGGGYTFNQRFSAYNQSMQNGSFDLRYRLSPHVKLRVHDRFVMTTGFFNQLQGDVGGVGTGIIQQPNVGIITPLAPHTDDTGTVELTYQYSASDMVGASGSVDISRFGTPPTGTAGALVNSTTEEGDGFYTHRFTPRNWSGIAYVFQRLSFSPVSEDVDTHSFFLFHTLYLQKNMILAFFAGPEYTELNNTVVSTSVTLPFVTVSSINTSQSRWSVAGGTSFSWQGKRTSVRASGVRKVSDGGGLLTAVDVTTGDGAVRRQLTRSSDLELGFLYAGSKALDSGAGRQ